MGLEPTKDLADGSYLAEVFDSVKGRERQRPVTVRAVEYSVSDGRDPTGAFRLITTILDPDDTGALDLVAAYAERCEIERCFDELKTDQRGGAALDVADACPEGDLETSLLPLRHPQPHVRRGARGRSRSRPGLLRRRVAVLPSVHPQQCTFPP